MIKIDESGNVIEKENSRAILVGASIASDISYSMEELFGLCEADNIEVLGKIIQNVDKINAGTYIGTGKVEEIAELCRNMDADLVVFNDELSGMQLRNLEDGIGVKVIDKTILILDIFADRAKSAEAKLQVELAQLSYRMPRLLGFGKSLSRLGGGIGTRGPGETKLETDRRHIAKRIDEIKDQIKEIKSNRQVQRSKRDKSELPVIALVGYTNSGKSSIMNRFLALENRDDKKVFEKDMLFATLETSQRLITLDDRHQFILIDTVGFVSKLPHTLVNAFKSTLEEACFADLLIHVVDVSYEQKDFFIDVTNSVLKELNAEDKPVIMAFNKCDLCENIDIVEYGNDSVLMSAKTGEGFDELVSLIKQKIFSNKRIVTLLIPFSKGDVLSSVMGKNKPNSLNYGENGTIIEVELFEKDIRKYEEYLINDQI